MAIETTAAAARNGSAGSGGRAGYVLLILFLANCFNAMDRSIITILVEAIKRDLHLDDTQIGIISGLGYALVYTLVGLAIAGLVNRGNRKAILASGVAFWSVMTTATGLTTGFGSMLAARFGIAAGEATCYPSALSLIGDYFPPTKRPRAIALFQLGTYGGIIAGVSLAGVIAAHFGWRAAFRLLGLPGLVLALTIWLTVREPERGMNDAGARPAPAAGSQDILRTMLSLMRDAPRFALLVTSSVSLAIAQVTMGTWVPAFLMRVHGVGQEQVGLLAGPIIGLSGVAGTLIGGFLGTRIADRNGEDRAPLKVMLYSAPAAIPAILLFLFAPGLPLTLAGGAFAAFFIAMHFGPLVAVIIGAVDAQRRGAATSLLASAQFLIGLGLGPLIVGAVSDALQPTLGQGSLRYAMLIAPLAVAIGWALALVAYRASGPARTTPRASA